MHMFLQPFLSDLLASQLVVFRTPLVVTCVAFFLNEMVVWLVLLCSRTWYFSISLYVPCLFATAVRFTLFHSSLLPQILYLSINRINQQILGVLMSLGRNDGLMRTHVQHTRAEKKKSIYK